MKAITRRATGQERRGSLGDSMDYDKAFEQAKDLLTEFYAQQDRPRVPPNTTQILDIIFAALENASEESPQIPPKSNLQPATPNISWHVEPNLTGQPTPDDLARRAAQWWAVKAILHKRGDRENEKGAVVAVVWKGQDIWVTYRVVNDVATERIQDLERVDE